MRGRYSAVEGPYIGNGLYQLLQEWSYNVLYLKIYGSSHGGKNEPSLSARGPFDHLICKDLASHPGDFGFIKCVGSGRLCWRVSRLIVFKS